MISAPNEAGVKREIFEQRLAELTASQEEEVTALVEEYRNDLAEVHDTVVRVSQIPGDSAARGLPVLARLRETAGATLEPIIADQTPVPDTFLLFSLADGIVSAERAVTARLKAALTDRREAPQPAAARFIEEVPPSRRVCDEAYVGLRRILHAESFLQHTMEMHHFLFLPEQARNDEIQSWLESGTFTRFLDDVDVGEE